MEVTEFDVGRINYYLDGLAFQFKGKYELDETTAAQGFVSLVFIDWNTGEEVLMEMHKLKKKKLLSLERTWICRISFENDQGGKPLFAACLKGEGLGGNLQNALRIGFVEVDSLNEFGPRDVVSKLEDYYE